MKFSIVIPNLHSPIVDQTINALLKQRTSSDYEIIIVGMDQYNLIAESPQVKAIHTEKPVWPSVARNIGLKMAKGEIICFLDSDCIPSADWLRIIEERFQDPKVCVLGGGVDSSQPEFWPVCNHISSFHEYLVSMPAGTRQELPSLNLMIRKSALDQAGGFDESRQIAEDSDLTTRLRQLGYALNFEPRAGINHLPDRRDATSVIQHAWTHGYHSIKVDPKWRAFLNLPLPFQHRWLLLLTSPVIALYVTLGIYRADRKVWRRWYVAPAIFVLKMAYCWGAAEKMRTNAG